jgi:integrase
MTTRKALTQQAVEKLRPDPTKVLERPDHLYPALRLIVQPSGARAFAVRTRINGKPVKITLKDAGLDLAAARAKTRELLAEIAAGHDPRASRRKVRATTFEGVAELFLKDAAGETRRKTQIERERHLRRDWAAFNGRPLAEIRKAEIAARLLEIKDERGAITANRSRTTLFRLFEWAVDQDLIEVNTVASTRRALRREPTRDRVLNQDERRAIWTATEGDGAYDAIVRLAVRTGQRKSELGGMMWREVDLDRAVWSLPGQRTKNGLAHVVPLSRQALAIIQAQPRRGEFVFGERGAAPFSGWSRCKRRLDAKCGVTGWTIHDVRRSVVTGMNDELGVAPHVVEAVVNHITGVARVGVAGTYNKAQYLAERTRALQSWADHLTGEPERKVVDFPQAGGAR